MEDHVFRLCLLHLDYNFVENSFIYKGMTNERQANKSAWKESDRGFVRACIEYMYVYVESTLLIFLTFITFPRLVMSTCNTFMQ